MEPNGRVTSRILGGAVASCFLLSALTHPERVQVRPPLQKVADVPMPGSAVRFDYQSMDPGSGRLYIAHMNAGQLVVFDTVKQEVVANLDGFKGVHGVWAASSSLSAT